LENPYWTTDGHSHHVNLDRIRLLCFDILNIFEASKPIAESIEYAEVEEEKPLKLKDFPLAVLHRNFVFKTVSERLLQLALMVRTYNDLMRESEHSENYIKHRDTNDDGYYVGSLEGVDKFFGEGSYQKSNS